ncbi:MAG: glutamate synthase large subunit [Bacteroidota bacterium]|nr:glutamate synthase large subunit [Bacteroidota bacterium]MDP4206411.1 glutamate synthase large subunit [Bacteroidota bacterium]
MQRGLPKAQGLYDPTNEHDNCGIGFVAHIKGHKSHDIILRGLEVLKNMDHRGATSADNKTGDGAGMLIQLPHEFFVNQGIDVPSSGKYGAGFVFLPVDEREASVCEEVLVRFIKEEGLELIGFREVPVDSSVMGEIAHRTEPRMKQVFIKGNLEQDVLERKLYLVRKQAEREVRESALTQKEYFYMPSLSSKVMVFKGMFTPDQLMTYFKDFQDQSLTSAIALVHSRFSTNTFPTWDLAQPFRIVAHNGEINTIRGNRLWMHARESLLKSEVFGEDIKKLFPIVEPGKSDSASLDNVLEFLFMNGRSLPHSLCMMVPESFNDKNPIPDSLKAFYEFHSTLMEPWDGPAALVFSDGRYIGGTLDRNGLRPSRYVITKNDMIVMGSEVGVQVFPPKEIKAKGRLRPGKILLVDTQLGIIIPDEEVKADLTRRNPYYNWLKENRIEFENIEVKNRMPSSMGDEFPTYANVYGYSKEDMLQVIKPMAINGQEPTASMGNDTPLAVFSSKPQRFFKYFRQIFAQVTNPPIDPIREGLVMSLTNYIGSSKSNILEESPEQCKLIKIDSPILTNTDLGKIKSLKHEQFTHTIIPMLFPANEGAEGFNKAFENMLSEAEKAVDEKKNFIILSDRSISKDMAPIPSLLAVAAVHHHLIKAKKRTQIGIIVETGEAREIMHFALLLGYGASIINPYLAFAAIADLVHKGEITLDYKEARKNYIKAIDKGLLKILSKMGISTLRSYHGAQIFESIGVNTEVIDRYFSGTAARISGIGMEEICKEALLFHQKAYSVDNDSFMFKTEGQFTFRKDGEHHAWNPETIGLLQWSTRTNDYKKFKEFSSIVDTQNRKPAFIRGALQWKKAPIDISEVEPVESIMRRFVTGAMSYGSISKEAHEALAIAMNTIGGRSNTGEGGEDSERFSKNTRSSIKQIASGRFGVTANYLANADELQIKVAQGAKPGEGGQLPGFKVNKIIAKTRNSTPGITLISPPPHHDIYSIEDLAQLIYDLKCTNPRAKVSVKLVSEHGVGTVAAGVAKAHSDLIVISGAEGGTGASPASSIYNAGLPAELGIAETQQTLVLNNLRGRVTLQVDGQLKTGRDVVIMGLLGAEEFGFATSALITLGCVMMRKCHLNTCPAGIATQDEKLRKRFLGRSEYVINFFRFIAEEVREYLAELGYTKFDDIVGRTDLLEVNPEVQNWKMSKVDFSNLLYFPEEAKKYDIRNTNPNVKKVEGVLDQKLIREANKAIKGGERVWIAHQIRNVDRSLGAMLSGEVALRYGDEGLPEDTINCTFFGSAGQSFGGFLAKGINFRLEGDSNDYLGKGLSGGKIVVVPPAGSTFKPEENIIVGNTTMYGATTGQVYIRGVAGERFCVRNSGAYAVVEGAGDHCCEYMTGGRVAVLGKTGRNFAAGMSGGIAYVLDVDGNFDYFCNKGLVELSSVEDKSDIHELQNMINQHMLHTHSTLASKILTNWDEYLPRFVKIIPFEYKKVLEENKLKELELKLQLTDDNPASQY